MIDHAPRGRVMENGLGTLDIGFGIGAALLLACEVCVVQGILVDSRVLLGYHHYRHCVYILFCDMGRCCIVGCRALGTCGWYGNTSVINICPTGSRIYIYIHICIYIYIFCYRYVVVSLFSQQVCGFVIVVLSYCCLVIRVLIFLLPFYSCIVVQLLGLCLGIIGLLYC